MTRKPETEFPQHRPSKRRKVILSLLAVCVLVVLVPWAGGHFQQQVPIWKCKIVAEYAHQQDDFTQGLLIHNGELLQGTGQFGESKLQRIDLKTGRVLQAVALPRQYFGEGIAIANDELFQLTWKNRVGFVYDPQTFQLKRTVRYIGQGWGLTFDGQSLIMSDGSATLRFYDPKTFRIQKRITVRQGRQTIDELNELEYVQGEIWANVWHKDYIVRIDPATGKVLGWIQLEGLKPWSLRLNREAVHNGIAYDQLTGKIYLTGKYWPKLYEVELIPQ